MGQKVYNAVMNRWLNSYDVTTQDNNAQSYIFKEGYDDPTFMTFRLEFGDWGASVLDRSIIETGTTSFIASKNNYDALPIGLLNCPYIGSGNQQSYWQTGADTDSTIFSDTKDYSAFRYLRSRNEDTRAKYLYYFVNGLFEIQKKNPYLFKKISGLDALENFDPKNGQRLKNDTKITVECYEGIGLKMRSLMEFYRKAAWDDVYQKWILPENMRQFKMIIYVFERRVFHKVAFTHDAETDKQISAFKYDEQLNGDIPVKAYECCPCEFDIAGSQSWRGDYASDFSGAEETTKLVINVKNVKTYFKNGLLNSSLGAVYDNNGDDSISGKINEIMIYDLVEGIERTSSINNDNTDYDNIGDRISNSTVNSVRSLFLNKNIIFENEEANPNIRAYLWGKSIGGCIDENALSMREIMSVYNRSIEQLLAYSLIGSAWAMGKSTDNISELRNLDDYVSQMRTNKLSASIDDHLMDLIRMYDYSYERSIAISPAIDDHAMDINRLYIPNPRGGWINVLVNGPSYDTNKSFWANLVDNAENILFGARRSVLLSGCNFTLGMDTWANTMNYLYYDSPYVSTAIEQPAHFMSLLPKRYKARKIKPVNFQERTIPEQTYETLEPERGVPAQSYNTLSPERTSPEQEINYMNDPREIPTQDMTELNDMREIPEQKYALLGDTREIPDQKYGTLDDLRDVPGQEYGELDDPRNIPDQKYNELANLRVLEEQDYKELGNTRDIPEQDYGKLNEPREKDSQDYKELNDVREIPDNMPDNLMAKLRTLPGFSKVTMNDLRDIPEQDLANLADTAVNVKPEYTINQVELLDTLNNTATDNDMKLLNLDADNLRDEEAIMDTLKDQMNAFKLQTIDDNDDKDLKKKKDIANFTKIFTDNASEIKNAIADNIVYMKKKIRNLSEESIRELPKMDIYVMDKDDNKEDKGHEMSMISLNDMKQIDKNMKILSLNEEQLRKLSFQTLINLHREIEKQMNETITMNGLSKIVNDNSIEKPIGNQDMKTAGKKGNRQMLTLAPPREVPNRHTIVY